jgi:hypothetical protein
MLTRRGKKLEGRVITTCHNSEWRSCVQVMYFCLRWSAPAGADGKLLLGKEDAKRMQKRKCGLRGDLT